MRKKSLLRPARPNSGRVFQNSRFGTANNRRPKRQGAYIDPAKFINTAVPQQDQPEVVLTHAFSDFDLGDAIQRNLIARNYITPTPIQDQAIRPALEGRDLIGLANTGTGKTAAFLLPILHKLLANDGKGSVLIMVPTRELAVQIDEEFRSFARGLKLYSAVCVGGASMQRQIAGLSRHPQIVIGTPGRLKDLVNQGVLRLRTTTTLVLDEADRMLDMGFIRDMRFLINELPAQRQSLFFSATMNREVESLISEFSHEPVTVAVGRQSTSTHIEQEVIKAGSKEQKFEVLCELLQRPGYEKVLIFGQTKWAVQRLADNLNKQGISSGAIHGNKTQPQRQKALKSFKNNETRILVATDVASRGLDIPNVSHVINFDQPNSYDDYVHRIGRTGRAGKQGHALTFVA